MELDKKLLKKLLCRSNLIKYCWMSTHKMNQKEPLWRASWLLDSCEKNTELEYILGLGKKESTYDLSVGVYLYHCHKKSHQFKLIACINEEGIKVYG